MKRMCSRHIRCFRKLFYVIGCISCQYCRIVFPKSLSDIPGAGGEFRTSKTFFQASMVAMGLAASFAVTFDVFSKAGGGGDKACSYGQIKVEMNIRGYKSGATG